MSIGRASFWKPYVGQEVDSKWDMTKMISGAKRADSYAFGDLMSRMWSVELNIRLFSICKSWLRKRGNERFLTDMQKKKRWWKTFTLKMATALFVAALNNFQHFMYLMIVTN